MTRRLLLVVVSVVSLVLAACGTDDDGVAVPGEPTGQEPTGAPIVVGMTSHDSGPRQQPAYADGLAAWVERVNSEGGIDGRPVEFRRCDSQSDLDRQAECARQHADNRELLIVSGLGTETGTVALPIYEPAGLGLISVSPFTNAEMTSENVIALSGSIRTAYPAMLSHFRDEGVDKVNMIALDIATVHEAVDVYERVAGELGLEWGGTTPLALDAADMLPAVTAALDGDPDVLLVQVLPPHLIGIMESLETLGVDTPVLAGSPFVHPDVLTLPASQERLFFESDVAPPEQYDEAARADYEYLQEQFGAALSNPHQLGFALGRAFQQAIEGAGGGEATRESVLEFIRTGEFVDLPFLPERISRGDAPDELPAVANISTFIVTPDGTGGFSYVTDRIEPTRL